MMPLKAATLLAIVGTALSLVLSLVQWAATLATTGLMMRNWQLLIWPLHTLLFQGSLLVFFCVLFSRLSFAAIPQPNANEPPY